MGVEISDEARRLVALFEDEAGVTVRDCIVDEDHDQVVYLIKRGEIADAIGPGGETVGRVEDQLGRDIMLVEDADVPAEFVANALAPAAVYNVTISENDDTVAYAEVPEADRGAAIGRDGRNIDVARTLAERHFDIDGIELA
jgi:N utilization substance protein A